MKNASTAIMSYTHSKNDIGEGPTPLKYVTKKEPKSYNKHIGINKIMTYKTGNKLTTTAKSGIMVSIDTQCI
jgi:hypothetical protein